MNEVEMKLKGKVAVVTGGGAGLGKAVAQRFALEGARVVIGEIEEHNGNCAADGIRKKGGEAVFVKTDVSKEAEVEALMDAAVKHYDGIDILYINAAVLFQDGEARAHELTSEVWDRTINVNLRGNWLCAKYGIPHLLARGGGSIIQLASPTGILGFTNLTAYSASKAGILGLMRAMTADYAGDNIRVNAIVPGTMDTPMNAPLLSNPEARSEFIAKAPLKRLGRPDDVAGLAVFLASSDSAYCTGGIYMVDGGMTAVI